MQLKVLENLKKENVEIYLEYLNSCKSSNWETWETTYKTYCNNFKLFLVWFQNSYKNRLLLSKDTLLEMPTIMESYRNYCRGLGNSKRTLMNKITAISTFYAWCVRRNKIKYHPFSEKLDRLRFTDKDKIRNSYFLTTEQKNNVYVISSCSEGTVYLKMKQGMYEENLDISNYDSMLDLSQFDEGYISFTITNKNAKNVSVQLEIR